MIKYENDIICVQLHGHSTCLLTSNYKKQRKLKVSTNKKELIMKKLLYGLLD